MVGVAELFDKTWFVALLMALRYDKFIVFWGCFMALAVHTVIAAAFGYTISKTVPVSLLHFSAATLYAFFAILYFKDWYQSCPEDDIISIGKEEAGEALTEKQDDNSYRS